MANENDRQFLLRWRRGVFNSDQVSSTKLTLLGLAEFASANGDDCCPSIESISRLTGLSERTVRTALGSPSPWFERVQFKRTGQAWNGYKYRLRIPEGAATISARSRFLQSEGPATVAASNQATTGKSRSNDRQRTTEGPATVADEQEKQEKQQERQSEQSPSPGVAVAFKAWWKAMPEEDWNKLRDRCCEYMKSIQADEEFFDLYQLWVLNRFTNDPQLRSDWPAFVFRALNDNWHKLWWFPSQDEPAKLTTTGEQLRRRDAAA